MITFDKKYLGLAIFIFLIEVVIAFFIHDHLIRPYIGDALVVVLLYCLIKSLLKLNVLIVVLFVLIFSFAVEFMQYMNIVAKLGLQNSKIARTVIGTSFSWIDLLTYIAGAAIVIIVEKFYSRDNLFYEKDD
ncbi:MAG: DUF2809 domain-containing protein [Saprospiraceae bacterium]